MGPDPDHDRILKELSLAEQCRQDGREGQARVCARRAAGWSVRRLYRSTTGETPPGSVLALLRWYRDLPGAPKMLRAAAGRLTVSVDETHRLPHNEDPIDDARRLVRELAGTGNP